RDGARGAWGEEGGEGRVQADQAWQPLRASPARDQAQLDLGQAELRPRVVNHDAVVAGRRQLQPAPQAGATDDGRARDGEARELVEDALARRGQVRGLFAPAD